MKFRRWLMPSYIADGFSELVFNLHRILFFALMTLLLSLPVITLGGAHLALFSVLRRLADGEKVPLRDYFRAFGKSVARGIPYGLGIGMILVAMSLPAKGVLGFCLVGGSFLMYGLLLFYPAVFNAGSRGINAFAGAVRYAIAYAWESLFLVGIAVLFVFAAMFLSEILLVLFFPLTFFITARIVIANNGESEENENNNKIINKTEVQKQ